MGSCNNFCSLWDACGYEYKGRCDCVGQRKFRPQIGMAPPPDALPSPEATPSPARGPQSPESREPLNARAAPIGDRIMKWRFRGSLTHDEFTEAMRLLRAIQAAPSPDPKLREAVDAFGDAVEALAKAEYRSSSEIELKPYKERYLAARANLLAPAGVDAGLREAVHAILGNGSDEERWPPGVEDHVALRTYVAKLEAARPHPEEQGEAQDLEALAEEVHKAYLYTCDRLGWSVKSENQVPYAMLSEASKELDRASVRAVLAALRSRTPSQGGATPPVEGDKGPGGAAPGPSPEGQPFPQPKGIQ